MKLELCVPCLFGLEGLVADELRRMDVTEVRPETGRVYFSGDWTAVVRANIGLRTGERVLITLGSFPARSFDALYEGALALDWAAFVPRDGAFPIKGHALGPTLRSVPDAQRILKKAAADKLGRAYGVERMPETGATYQVQFAIRDDVATIYLDTTGAGLYKRGYRPVSGVAPLRETLAAAMVTLSRYRGRDVLADPFCGSGTIAIEAALAARNRAPGLYRRFAAETWPEIPSALWDEVREAARAKEFHGSYTIFASDIDPHCIELAQENARRAGVEADIRFAVADARRFEKPAAKGVIVTNPPYGERVLERSEAEAIVREFGKAVRNLSGWEMYILSAHADFERDFGRQADKKRKLYNGMIKSQLYMYR
ncbi:MAG: class I SAM-dependent RNA methyltransferase [Oscillospiraceae bacterium]|nr:class I SAM-dependent RNA methyltransferase [Oscillospiraceae bacterium]